MILARVEAVKNTNNATVEAHKKDRIFYLARQRNLKK